MSKKIRQKHLRQAPWSTGMGNCSPKHREKDTIRKLSPGLWLSFQSKIRNPVFFLFLLRRTANQPCAIERQMKRIFLIICFIGAMMASMNLRAQTPEEVVERMNAELRKGDSLGMTFDFVMSIPILGEFKSTNYTLGDKLRVDLIDKDKKTINWSDGTTEWEYDSEKNEVKITNAKPKEENTNSGDANLVTGVSEGYDLSFDKKTDDEVWYITCKKNKSNKDKDDPKRIDLAVAKADYSTVYMKTKSNGIRISMENFKIGVSEAQVTFNPADYPNAKIIDER